MRKPITTRTGVSHLSITKHGMDSILTSSPVGKHNDAAKSEEDNYVHKKRPVGVHVPMRDIRGELGSAGFGILSAARLISPGWCESQRGSVGEYSRPRFGMGLGRQF